MNAFAYIPGTQAWRHRRDVLLCRRAAHSLHEIVDGEIGSAKMARELQRHLEACERCGCEADVIRDLKRAIARVGSDCDQAFVGRLEDLARQLCEGTETRQH